jgi:hypothetical protein
MSESSLMSLLCDTQAAQEREELQAAGDTLDARITQCEAEVRSHCLAPRVDTRHAMNFKLWQGLLLQRPESLLVEAQFPSYMSTSPRLHHACSCHSALWTLPCYSRCPPRVIIILGVCVKGADPAVLTGREANGRNPMALLG